MQCLLDFDLHVSIFAEIRLVYMYQSGYLIEEYQVDINSDIHQFSTRILTVSCFSLSSCSLLMASFSCVTNLLSHSNFSLAFWDWRCFCSSSAWACRLASTTYNVSDQVENTLVTLLCSRKYMHQQSLNLEVCLKIIVLRYHHMLLYIFMWEILADFFSIWKYLHLSLCFLG